MNSYSLRQLVEWEFPGNPPIHDVSRSAISMGIVPMSGEVNSKFIVEGLHFGSRTLGIIEVPISTYYVQSPRQCLLVENVHGSAAFN